MTTAQPSASVRPFRDAVVRDVPPTPLTTDWLTRWLASEACATELVYFEDYPAQALLSPISKAFMYHCVRSLKPNLVIEIGTYHGGTSEVIARALAENGSGQLYTTDPYGADRCPAIIAAWPPELRSRVEFFALNSMNFYLELERRRGAVDIAFIDGNHEHAYAVFDLLMSAKNLTRGGTIIMDNVEQAGPYFAATEFLRAHPSWNVVGVDHTLPSRLAHPLDSTFNRSSFRDATLLILTAPETFVVSATTPLSVQRSILPVALSGIRIEGDTGDPTPASGVLFWEVIYRVFPADSFPVEIKRTGLVKEPLGGRLECRFDEPVTSTAVGPCNLEVNLLHRANAQPTYSFHHIDLICQDGSMKPFLGRTSS